MAAIEELAAEVDRAELVAAVEQAAAMAASRTSGRKLEARLDTGKGVFSFFSRKRVAVEVLDPETEVALDAVPEGARPGDLVAVPEDFGTAPRSAARAAREVLHSRLRGARLLSRASRYRKRIGKLETGTVVRREGRDLIVDLGPVEARLSAAEQSRHEVFNPGDVVRASVRAVEREEPPVILSRIAPDVVSGVMERETPAIRRGEVEVRKVARLPGVRAKAAVAAGSRMVDPVAACLGPRGSTIRAVTRELRGEQVDVIRWSECVEDFARNALRPARVLQVEPWTPDGATGGRGRGRRRKPGLLVTVSAAELPRALGKRGQNVRLASELLGMPIEVVAEGQAPRQRRGRERVRRSRRGRPPGRRTFRQRPPAGGRSAKTPRGGRNRGGRDN